MLTKVLIANRGEIAVRVIRACKEMGIATVAVYSELDREALHVRLADEAYALGGQTAAESYLNTERILEVIEQSGADGVHPGYGFFSENTDFARAITERGVAFIGPPPEAIEVMGDKVSSRIAAQAAGVSWACPAPPSSSPRTPRSRPSARSSAGRSPSRPPTAAAVAACASSTPPTRPSRPSSPPSRRPSRASAATSATSSATSPGRATWRCRSSATPTGNVVWVGERDCSAQRRHQKLIEESPAPEFPAETRQAMGEAAVKVAKACGYYNAGTVEFLYQDGEFWFLEMNTRLQVEHPVTELVSGIDLVREQIRVASGEPLSFTQDEIDLRGWAIEVRVNAEDPAGGKFLPSPGTIAKLVAPQGFGIRWDGGYESGDEVSQYYDNLVGKLIVWGSDRPTAIGRMIRALEEMVVEGIATTIPADLAILRHPDFAAGQHSTKWVEDTLDLTEVTSGGGAPADVEGEAPKVERSVDVEVNGKRFAVKMWVPDVPVAVVAGGAAGGAAPRPRRAAAGGAAAAGSGKVTVPMQGTIVKVLVEVGQAVEAGQAVCVLEAMKMENNIAADKAGTVTEIKVETGQSVGSGDVVVVIE